MNMQEVYKYLSTVLPEGHVKQDEMLKNHTHIKVGGKADVLLRLQIMMKFKKLLNMRTNIIFQLRFRKWIECHY